MPSMAACVSTSRPPRKPKTLREQHGTQPWDTENRRKHMKHVFEQLPRSHGVAVQAGVMPVRGQNGTQPARPLRVSRAPIASGILRGNGMTRQGHASMSTSCMMSMPPCCRGRASTTSSSRRASQPGRWAATGRPFLPSGSVLTSGSRLLRIAARLREGEAGGQRERQPQ